MCMGGGDNTTLALRADLSSLSPEHLHCLPGSAGYPLQPMLSSWPMHKPH